MTDVHEYVYIIGGNMKYAWGTPISQDGYYKIGYTGKYPTQRLNELQTGNPLLLTLVGYLELPKGAGYHREAELHREYEGFRSVYITPDGKKTTEWFKFTPRQLRGLLMKDGVTCLLPVKRFLCI